MPAVGGVRCPPQPVFEFVCLLGVDRTRGVLDHAKQIIGMYGRQPAVGLDLAGVWPVYSYQRRLQSTSMPSALRRQASCGIVSKSRRYRDSLAASASSARFRSVTSIAMPSNGEAAGGIVKRPSLDEYPVQAAIGPECVRYSAW